MNEFNARYISILSEKKKESKFLGFFGSKAPKHTQDDNIKQPGQFDNLS